LPRQGHHQEDGNRGILSPIGWAGSLFSACKGQAQIIEARFCPRLLAEST
jgi:hypothetical protein